MAEESKRPGFMARWRKRREDRAGVSRGLHFDVGFQSAAEPLPDVADVWTTYGTDLPDSVAQSAEPLDMTLLARPDERTAELVQRETTYFSDDLTDPRNPKHAAWEAQEEEAIKEAEERREHGSTGS